MPNFQADIKDISVLNSYVSRDGDTEGLLCNLQYVADILQAFVSWQILFMFPSGLSMQWRELNAQLATLPFLLFVSLWIGP